MFRPQSLRLTVLFCCLSMAFLPCSVQAKKRALVIGIEAYPNVRPLQGPALDAKNISAFLITSMGYTKSEIRTLINADASRQNILQQLQEWLIDTTESGDEVLFYFSGHGYQTQDQNGDEPDGYDEVLVAYDVGVSNGRILNLISDDEIGAIFDQLKNRKSTVIIDSCHSGTLTRGPSSSQNEAIKTIFSLPKPILTRGKLKANRHEKAFLPSTDNLEVWTAVAASQKALVDIESRRGSIFTNLFIRGIQDHQADSDTDGTITRAELFHYIRYESDQFCNRNKGVCKTGLTPTLEVSDALYGRSLQTPVNSHSLAQVAEPDISTVIPLNEISQQLPKQASTSVELGLFPTETVTFGQEFSLQVRSQIDGYLLIFDISSGGQLVQLFPNKFSDAKKKSNRVYAGQTLLFPSKEYGFGLKALPPAGQGEVIAVISTDDVLPQFNAHKDLQVVEEPRRYIQEISNALRAVWHGDTQIRSPNWSIARQPYHIIN